MDILSDTAKPLRWKSRRGLLELDLLLEQFWRRHGGQLAADETRLLAGWLEMDDNDLWLLLQTPPDTAAAQALAAKIRPPAAL